LQTTVQLLVGLLLGLFRKHVYTYVTILLTQCSAAGGLCLK